MNGVGNTFWPVLVANFGLTLIAAWGFDLQYGTARVVNLAFIVAEAAGAYAYSLLTIGPPAALSGTTYIFGATLPWPVALVCAGLAGAAVCAVVGLICLPRLTEEYFGIATLVLAVGAATLVSADPALLNGDAGLAGIPAPLVNTNLPDAQQLWIVAALAAGLAAVVWLLLRLIDRSPLSRHLRATRDSENAARAVGISVMRSRFFVMIFGGVLGGIAGGLLAGLDGAWNTGSWSVFEVVVLLTAIVVGGAGNRLGVLVGAFVVTVLLAQGTQQLPAVGSNPTLNSNLQLVVIAVVQITFLWLRPQGLLPEKIRMPRRGPVFGRLRRQRAEPERSTADGRSVAGAAPRDRAWPKAASPRPVSDDWRSHGGPPPTADSAGTAETVLRIEDVLVRFGGVEAVAGATFAVGRGITFLIGPNGAGKSTVVTAIGGHQKIHGGEMWFQGRPLRGSPVSRARAGISRTFQLPQTFGTLSTLENVMVAVPGQRGTHLSALLWRPSLWRRQEAQIADQAMDILHRCHLAEKADVLADRLSGGQAKLLELARAMATNPKLMILDEPFAGVAPHVIDAIMDVLRKLRNQGIHVLIIAHEMSVVRELADLVIVMDAGKLLAEGTYDEVVARSDVQEAYLGVAAVT